VTFPPLVAIFTLLVPLLIVVPLGMLIVANTPLPYNTLLLEPSKLIVAMLPIPVTFATATAYAFNALPTLPLTFAPATAFAVVAYVAKLTAPDTLLPATLLAVVA
jgi:hypothetical protein